QMFNARKAAAVRSVPLRSNGNRADPLRNVGQPPLEFCESSSHFTPAATDWRTSAPWARDVAFRYPARLTSVPAVSSTLGTPPLLSVQAHPPGAAPLWEFTSVP